MARTRHRGRSWVPTDRQARILRASLLDADAALADVDVATLDAGTLRLLPLLEEHLRRHGVDPPASFTEVRTRAWRDNEILFFEGARMLAVLAGDSIPALVLKGAPLALLSYDDPSLRPMNDVDLLVPRDAARPAIRLFMNHGWTPAYRNPESLVDFQHAVEFENADGFRCDLHWRVLAESRPDIDDAAFWSGRMPMTLAGFETSTLNAADQLLHICVHAAAWTPTAPARWIADAVLLLRKTPSLDWPRVIDQAERHDVIPPVREMLAYLRERFEAAIPADVLAHLRELRGSRRARVRYFLFSHPRRPVTRFANVHHWLESARHSPARGLHRKVRDLTRYVWAVKLFPRSVSGTPARSREGSS